MQRVDFLHPSRPSALGVVLLMAGTAAVVGALWFANGWKQERLQAESAARAQAEAASNERRLAQKPVEPSPDERRLQRVAPQLRQPWLPALRLIESVTEAPIFLTSLAFDPARGQIRIDGEAPSFDAALTYSQLVYEAGVVDDAQLVSHDQTKSPMGDAPVKFTVVAQWRQR